MNGISVGVDDDAVVPHCPQGAHSVVPTRFTGLRVLDPADDVGDLVECALVFAHQSLSLLNGVNHRGVVAAAKETGNRGIAQLSHVSEDIHGDLAGRHQWPLA